MNPKGLVAEAVLHFYFFILLGSAFQMVAADAATTSSNAAPAIVLTIEGRVEVLPVGGRDWEPAKANQVLAAGHRLRTGAKSRAAIRLSNLSVLRVGELMEYEIEAPRTVAAKPLLNIKAGAAYFFSRDKPRVFDIRTPVASGAIRGTEFNVEVGSDGKTILTLVDGEVELSNAQGSVVLGNGEQGAVEAGRAPVKTAVINAVNIIQWNLYYPAILDLKELPLSDGERQAFRESITAYKAGDLPGALNKYPTNRPNISPAEKIYKAQLFLAVGSTRDAQSILESVPSDDAKLKKLALALQDLIATVTMGTRALSGTPATASEWLAQSYYSQSHGQLEPALDAARKSIELSPAFGFGWERVAELEFSFGHTAAALDALKQSLTLTPRNAQALALKGFLLAAKNRVRDAHQAFDEAISLDGALANGWLGRGLCRIREGHDQAGRQDLEVAAALEPNRALLRSYLGKAFSEVGDNVRAEHELKLSRQFDPNDPTSWLYAALLHQQQNRVNEAITDLETSESLNENRRIYRSRLLLDEDAAVRGANLATIYRDAGMNDVSVREASRAVNADYANYSAHLFLADSYNELRDPNQVNLRYETPWFSEYLIANLLAPVGAGTLSQTVSQQDYSRLFEHDGFGRASRTEYLSKGDWLQAGSQYGNFGNFGYAVDTLYRSTLGWRPNNDHEDLTLSAQIKQQITPADILFFQALYYDANGGDLTQYYDQSSAHLGLRFHETQEPNLLLGYSHEWCPGSHLLLLGARFYDEYRVSDTNDQVLTFGREPTGEIVAVPVSLPSTSLAYQSRAEIWSAEAQQIWESHRHSLIIGGRFQTGEFRTESTLGPMFATLRIPDVVLFPFFASNGPVSATPDFERWSAYGYYNLRLLEPLLLTGGVAYDYLRQPVNFRLPPIAGGTDHEDQVSPKAGLTWTPSKDTVFRFAYTRSLAGVSFDQSVRLEPTQVAGFNQALRSIIPESIAGSISGEKFETFGAAFEQKFPTRTYLGIDGQILNSNVRRTVGDVDFVASGGFGVVPQYGGVAQKLDYTEKDLLVTLNQLVGRDWSFGVRYWVSKADLSSAFPQVPSWAAAEFTSHRDAILHQIDIFALLNHPSGFFARADGLWNYQVNEGADAGLGHAEFWQVNLFAGYRFFHRHAQVQVGLLNVTDKDYKLNPVNLYTELPRRRTFTTSLEFTF